MVWVEAGEVGGVPPLESCGEIKHSGLIGVEQGTYNIVQGPLRNRVLILQNRQGAKSNNEDKGASGDSSRRWARQTWMFVLL